MKRRLSILTLTTLAAVAFVSVTCIRVYMGFSTGICCPLQRKAMVAIGLAERQAKQWQ